MAGDHLISAIKHNKDIMKRRLVVLGLISSVIVSSICGCSGKKNDSSQKQEIEQAKERRPVKSEQDELESNGENDSEKPDKNEQNVNSEQLILASCAAYDSEGLFYTEKYEYDDNKRLTKTERAYRDHEPITLYHCHEGTEAQKQLDANRIERVKIE